MWKRQCTCRSHTLAMPLPLTHFGIAIASHTLWMRRYSRCLCCMVMGTADSAGGLQAAAVSSTAPSPTCVSIVADAVGKSVVILVFHTASTHAALQRAAAQWQHHQWIYRVHIFNNAYINHVLPTSAAAHTIMPTSTMSCLQHKPQYMSACTACC